jgi:hypothetical protein
MSYPPVSSFPSKPHSIKPVIERGSSARGSAPGAFLHSSKQSLMHDLDAFAFDLFAFPSEMLQATQQRQTRVRVFFVLHGL